MLRTLSILAGLVFVAAPAAAADNPKTSIRWHGQSFFEIVSKKGTRIVIDPHAIPAFGRTALNADVVLCSHHHTDHTQLTVVQNIKKLQDQKMVFIGTKEVNMKQQYVDFDETVKDVKFKNLRLFHDDSEGMRRGLNTAIIIEVDGLRIVHLGDIGHQLTEKQLEKLGKVDVLMVPVGGVYTLNGIDAYKLIKKVQPTRYVLPMHYGIQGFDDLLKVTVFTDEVEGDEKKPFALRRYPTTNELLIDSADKTPDKPIVAVLHWKMPDDKTDKTDK
jgi:L-ascorbate metabolism protein UlaG (beta-lactamase superfamily)